MGARMFGSPIKRREDPRLITGQAKYTDDFTLPRMAHLAVVRPIPCAWVVPGSDAKTPPYPPVAVDVVRYVGNAVAVVVATDRYLARDAAEAVEVDYDPLPVVVDAEKATRKGAPQLHGDVPGNAAFHWKVSGGDVDAAFQSADVVVGERIINQRLIPNHRASRRPRQLPRGLE